MRLNDLTILLSLFFFIACNNTQHRNSGYAQAIESAGKDTLIAQTYFSGFEDAHDTYNAISAASNGKIYYVLSSTRHDLGGQLKI